MIRVVRPAKPPAILQRRAPAARERLCQEFDAASNDYLSGKRSLAIHPGIYGNATVKKALCDAQHGKCAFCESKVTAVAYGDVEHFRPKAGYQQRRTDKLKKPGYYWLAYEWSNLLYVCQICNQKHKGNLFPLARPEDRAVCHHDDLAREEPLLIDPAAEDPQAHVGFRDEVAFPCGSGRKGEATIEVLGLNRPALMERRRDLLRKLKLLCDLRTLLRDGIASQGSRASSDMVARLAEIDAELESASRDRREYAAMVRCLLA